MDPRYCSPQDLLACMHKNMLLCRVLGLAREFAELCVPLTTATIILNAEDCSDTSQLHNMYTWKAEGARYAWDLLIQ